MKEKNIQSLTMLEVSNAGTKIFRNNCGVHKTEDGRFVKYGVANPGGSDLIGWTPVEITQDMVGKKIAVFTAIEVKTPTGRIRKKQQSFLDNVRNDGGIAGIARSPEDALALLPTTETREEDNQ